jgi:hypothetical protein
MPPGNRSTSTPKTRATLKLLEAVGLVLALGAWALEGSLVRQFEQAGDDLRGSIASVQDAYNTAHTSSVVQLEAAVSRAVAGDTVTALGPNTYYAAAWASPEVRAKWAHRTIQDLRLLRNLFSVLQTHQREYGLPTRSSLVSFSRQLEAREAAFRSAMDSTIGPDAGPPTPDIRKMPGRDAGAFDRNLYSLHAEMAPIVSATFMSMHRRTRVWSTLFRVLFTIGSVLLIAAKILEWRVERRAVDESLPPPAG